jgi:hypothetical protein
MANKSLLATIAVLIGVASLSGFLASTMFTGDLVSNDAADAESNIAAEQTAEEMEAAADQAAAAAGAFVSEPETAVRKSKATETLEAAARAERGADEAAARADAEAAAKATAEGTATAADDDGN